MKVTGLQPRERPVSDGTASSTPVQIKFGRAGKAVALASGGSLSRRAARGDLFPQAGEVYLGTCGSHGEMQAAVAVRHIAFQPAAGLPADEGDAFGAARDTCHPGRSPRPHTLLGPSGTGTRCQ